jgi:hypothetical protein
MMNGAIATAAMWSPAVHVIQHLCLSGVDDLRSIVALLTPAYQAQTIFGSFSGIDDLRQ